MNLPADIPSYLSSQGTLSEPQEGYSNSENGSHQQLMPSHANGYVHKGTDGNISLFLDKGYKIQQIKFDNSFSFYASHYNGCCDVFQQEYVMVKWAVMLIQTLMECWVVMWALSLLDVAASIGANLERDRQMFPMVRLHFEFINLYYLICLKMNFLSWFTCLHVITKSAVCLTSLPADHPDSCLSF